MASAEHYRDRAAELMTRADGEADPQIRSQYEALSLAYLRLAELADLNAQTDIVYEPPLELPPVQPSDPQHSQPQAQQQQQQQQRGDEGTPDGNTPDGKESS